MQMAQKVSEHYNATSLLPWRHATGFFTQLGKFLGYLLPTGVMCCVLYFSFFSFFMFLYFYIFILFFFAAPLEQPEPEPETGLLAFSF